MKNRNIVGMVLLLFVQCAVCCTAEPDPDRTNGSESGSPRYNVLFICADDLRPVLGAYGNQRVKTPNIDALAGRGTVFTRAYCQGASCLPSRTSVLTGLRPGSTGITSNGQGHFRKNIPGRKTLPQYFKQKGAFTRSFGKMFHVQDPSSWSTRKFLPESDYGFPIYGGNELRKAQRSMEAASYKSDDWWGYQEGRNRRWVKARAWEVVENDEVELFDQQVASAVIEELRKREDERFFLAPGFFRPHLPFIAPEKYFALYPLEEIELPDNRSRSEGAPPYVHYNSAELRSYKGIPEDGSISKKRQKKLLRAYYASVSYVDAQIGRILDELKRRGLKQNTVVVLWSDHGYHFGEHGTWNKSTNFEEATRSTLIVSSPDQRKTGTHTEGIVELVDLFPTLCDLCNLPLPDQQFEGISFAPLLDHPDRPWKKAAFSQSKPYGVRGKTLRTSRYRYTEWYRNGEREAVELYDHRRDPGENVNRAGKTTYEETIERLRTLMNGGWERALPDGVEVPFRNKKD